MGEMRESKVGVERMRAEMERRPMGRLAVEDGGRLAIVSWGSLV